MSKKKKKLSQDDIDARNLLLSLMEEEGAENTFQARLIKKELSESASTGDKDAD